MYSKIKYRSKAINTNVEITWIPKHFESTDSLWDIQQSKRKYHCAQKTNFPNNTKKY